MDIALRIDKFFKRYNKSKLNDIDLYNIYRYITNYRNLNDFRYSQETLFYIVKHLNEFSDIFVNTDYEHHLDKLLIDIALEFDIEYCVIFEYLDNIKYKLQNIIKALIDRIKYLYLNEKNNDEKIIMLQKNIINIYKLIGNDKENYDLEMLFDKDITNVVIFIQSLYQDNDDFKCIFNFYDKVVANTKYSSIYKYNTPKQYKKYYWFKMYKLKLK